MDVLLIIYIHSIHTRCIHGMEQDMTIICPLSNNVVSRDLEYAEYVNGELRDNHHVQNDVDSRSFSLKNELNLYNRTAY